jgi:hypothetical protein
VAIEVGEIQSLMAIEGIGGQRSQANDGQQRGCSGR